MTTPNPTAAEIARLLAWAKEYPNDSTAHGRHARAVATLSAQLAESERARAALLSAVRQVLHGDKSAPKRGDGRYPHVRSRRLGNIAMVVRQPGFIDECCEELDNRDGILVDALVEQESADQTTAPAQPPEPVEPSDDQLFKIEVAARADAHGSDDWRAQNKAARRALYRAGLAAEAAAHEKARAAWSSQAHEADGQRMRLRDELERVRVELSEMTQRAINAEVGQEDAIAIIDELRAQARARRVPTFKDFEDILDQWWVERTGAGASRKLYDRLFAEAPPINERDLIRALHDGLVRDGHQLNLSMESLSSLARAAMTALGFQDSPGASPEGETDDRTDRDPIHRGATPDNDRPGQPGPDDAPARADEHDQSSSERAKDAGAEHRGHEARGSVPLGRPSAGNGPSGRVDHARAVAYCATDEWDPDEDDVVRGCYLDLRKRLMALGFADPAQPEPLVTSDDEPPVPLPGPAIRYLAVTPWKPTVGDRAVLVASPDPIDRDLVGQDVGICGKDMSSVDRHWKVAAFGASGTNREVHRDATWRPASTPEAAWNYSAPPDSEIGKWHELLGRCGDVTQFEYSGRFPSPYAPEGEPPRTWWGSATAPATLAMDEEGSVKAWRPASAAPARADNEPGGFLDALTRRVEELELQHRVGERVIAAYHDAPGTAAFLALRARIEREERSK